VEIKPEAVAHIIFGARRLSAGEELRGGLDDEPPSGGSINIDEALDENLAHEEHESDPAWLELRSFVDELPHDEQCELIALAWLGRGEGSKAEWPDLLKLARERRSDHTAAYLLGMPLLADYLQDALDAFDISIEDFEDEHG
jgi:hypothetical protein